MVVKRLGVLLVGLAFVAVLAAGCGDDTTGQAETVEVTGVIGPMFTGRDSFGEERALWVVPMDLSDERVAGV